MKSINALVLAGLLAMPAVTLAQADQATPSEQRAAEVADQEDRGEWGWIGLLGLAGLLGLRRREHADVRVSGRA